MADKNIKITVRDRRAIVEGSPVIICGNSGYTVTFTLDDEWSKSGVRTARFVYVKDGIVQHEDKVFSGSVVEVPIMSNVAFVKVGLFAGDLCTTTPARINCEASILCGSGAVHEPTPDVYNQIMALFEEMAEKGAFGATEEQVQQIDTNTADIAALVSGSKKAAKATNADNAASLGGETAATWQSKLDTIQTTSTASFSTPGWYRVAEYNGNSYSVAGSSANGCTIIIRRNYGKNANESYRILFDTVHVNRSFIIQSAKSNKQLITKIRYVTDKTSKAYIEIYYTGEEADGVRVTITDGLCQKNNCWKAITPTLTEETVEGLTPYAVTDIPANASPVNSMDLANGTYPLGVVGKNNFILYPEGGTFDSKETLTGQLRITLPQTWTNTSISFKVRIRGLSVNDYAEYDISGYTRATETMWKYCIAESKSDSIKAKQPVTFAHDGEKCVVCIGNVDSTWVSNKVQITDVMVGHYVTAYDNWATGWNISVVADNSDLTVSATVENPNTLTTALAGYLKNTGGEINGDVSISSSEAKTRQLKLINSLREIRHALASNGEYFIVDYTNNNRIITSKPDGTNTLNGIATGNLPLTGGTLTGGLTLADVGGDEGGELRFGSPVTNTDFAGNITLDVYKNFVRFFAEHDGKAKTFHIDFPSMKEGVNTALHTGNSNAIVFTEDDTTAPSDTTALWAHL